MNWPRLRAECPCPRLRRWAILSLLNLCSSCWAHCRLLPAAAAPTPRPLSVKIWQKAECKKKLTLQGHFESLRPMSVFPSKGVCNTLNCHLLVWPIYQTLMMKIIINLVDTPSKSTVTNSLEKCHHCTQICHLLVWPIYQAQQTRSILVTHHTHIIVTNYTHSTVTNFRSNTSPLHWSFGGNKSLSVD